MKFYNIKVTINTNQKPPYFLGSTLRGALGYALKKVTCINPTLKCEGCFAKDNCLYYNYYEKPNSFHNYRFSVDLASKNFNFNLYLFNQDQQTLPYIISALHTMLTEHGLTRDKYKFNDFIISVNNIDVYKDSNFIMKNNKPIKFECNEYFENIKIKLLTPLRIKRDSKFLRDSIELEDILRSIYQREQELEGNKRVYKLNYTPKYKTKIQALTYKQLTRKSSRQKQKLSIDGLIGELVVMGIDKQSYYLLKLGEIIGVGKQTVMGLGKIKIEKLE